MPTHPDALQTQLKAVLDDARSFQHLPPEDQLAFRDDLERVLRYLAQPAGGPTAEALDTQATQRGNVGGQVVGATGDQMRSLAGKVDFPAFVGGLIKGVFKSIIDASIKQMKAYQDLVASVVKSVEEFADSDKISSDEVQSHLMNSFAGLLVPEGGQMVAATGADKARLDEKLKEMGVDPDLNVEANQKKLLDAAKLELAAQKQKLLATMVLMGIDRIIVTDGMINATVDFSVVGSETFNQTGSSSSKAVDRQMSSTAEGDSDGTREMLAQSTDKSSSTDLNQLSKSLMSSAAHQSVHLGISTPRASRQSTNDQSESSKATLHGGVKVKFKSQTFPLERMAPGAMTQLMGVAKQAPASAATLPAQTATTADPGSAS